MSALFLVKRLHHEPLKGMTRHGAHILTWIQGLLQVQQNIDAVFHRVTSQLLSGWSSNQSRFWFRRITLQTFQPL